MQRKKTHIEDDKALAEKSLAARLEILNSKGMADAQIKRDAMVRHFRGEIRQANYRLTCIAKLAEQMARKAEIKAEKLATPKVNAPKKRQAADPVMKKAKKERKQAAVEADEE